MATLKGSCLFAALAVASLSGCTATANRTGDRQVFIVESQVTQLEREIEKRSSRIHGMQQDMQHAVDALMAPDAGTTERLFLLERTRSLSEEQARLQAELARLNAEVAVKRAQLETLRHSLAANS